METSEIKFQDQVQNMPIINGDMTPAKAYDAISGVIDANIKFYQLQGLCQWEQNHDCCTQSFDDKIKALRAQKDQLNNIIRLANETGCSLKIDGALSISLVR